MEIFPGYRAIARSLRRPAVAIGNFDGVHRGHQRLFSEILRRARSRGGEAVVLTFQPHPAKVLAPALAPPLICTHAARLRRIGSTGVDVCVVEPFDRALADLSPEEFVDDILVRGLGAEDICVGYDFTFGRGRAGDTSLLTALGRARGFDVVVIEPVAIDGLVCSSTKVRQFVLEGKIEGAALLLGRDPEVEGVVVHGAGRGRTIGVPTANLAPETELLPAPGVYAGWAELPTGERFPAAINLGSNPTFGGAGLSLEAHLLDYAGGDLHGVRLRVGFKRRLRSEMRFPTSEALVAQIREDIEATRAIADLNRPGARR